MLFLNISLPSISGHFRFDSVRFNALPRQLISSLCKALPPQFVAVLCLRVSYPRLAFPLLLFSHLFRSHSSLFNSIAVQPFPCNSTDYYSLPSLSLNSTYLRFSMAYLSVAFPLHFYAPLFHFLAMLFRHSSFQFYAYAIGLIAVPLRRFTIPMHCPAIQCRCHPMQFSSIAVRN